MIPANLAHGLKPCPKCKAPNTHLTAKPLPPHPGSSAGRWRIQCDTCKHEGASAAFVGGAISMWNDESPAVPSGRFTVVK